MTAYKYKARDKFGKAIKDKPKQKSLMIPLTQ